MRRVGIFNDDLIDAAMRRDTKNLNAALKGEADPNASRDMYGIENRFEIDLKLIQNAIECKLQSQLDTSSTFD